MAGEYIFTMRDLRKVVPPSREILKGIYLSFFPGAKIGVLGANGAGKSSLLRIMAGVDKDFLGDARPLPGTKIGYLPQEPQLDPAKDVRGNVEEAVAEQRGLLRQFEEISARFAEPMDDDEMTRLLEKQGNLQERIDALGLWELDHKVDIAMDALRLPPGDADVTRLSGGERRRVALCRVLLEQPDMLLLDEPTNHLDAESVWWLERFLAQFPGTVVAVTHDRYFLDNVAGWILELYQGAGIPWEGNYSSWLEQKERRLATGGEAGLRPAEDAAARARVGAAGAPGAAGQEQGAHHPVRGAPGGGGPADRGQRRDPDPRPRAAGRRGGGREEPEQGVWRPAADRRPQLLAPAGRHRGRDRPQRRGQDHALPDDHRAGAAGRRHAHRGLHGADRLRGPEPGRARPRQDRLPGDLRRPGSRSSSASAA